MNTVTASGTSGDTTYTDDDDHTLDVLGSGINVTKSGPATAGIGELVTYTFTVTNSGEVPLSNVTVVDDVAGTATYQSGDTNSNNKLDVSETWTYTATWTVATTPDPLVNTVTASGTSGNTTYTDDDDHTLDVLGSGINVTKSGPATAGIGELVTYTFAVTNSGEVPLSNVTVVDDVAGTATYQSGDTNSDNKLDLTETWTYTATWTVASAPDPLVNTVTASGTSGNTTYTDDDDHTLDVLGSGINVTKSGPATAGIGELVTYTFTVTNSGEVPLSNVTVVDDVAGTVTYQSGDTNSNNKTRRQRDVDLHCHLDGRSYP